MIALAEFSDDRLRFISSLAIVEVRSAISRKLRLQQITGEEATDAVQRLFDEARRVITLPIGDSTIQRACEAVEALQLRSLDAIQLACVLQASERAAEPLIFVSADGRLLDAARSAGLSVLDVGSDGSIHAVLALKGS